ncbi:hypothetical protein Emed_002809 [Eimeria media]
MEAGQGGAGGPGGPSLASRGPRGSRTITFKEPQATPRGLSSKAGGGGGAAGSGNLLLNRRKRSGIMRWLFNPFVRKEAEDTPTAAAAAGAAGEGGVSGEQAAEETSAAVPSSLRSAASLFSLARISGGRLSSGGAGTRPPVFERRRRRHKTVVWRYKKTIGLFASFVFISNQILASGLLGMPSLVRAAGPLSASAVILVFCGISSACALLLLKSMTLIEGNATFSERFEYSAILRYFLSVSPPEPAASLQQQQQGGEGDAGDEPTKAKEGVAALVDRALYKATGLGGASSREAEREAAEAAHKVSPSLSLYRLQGFFRLLQQRRALPLLRETMGGWWLRWNRTSLSQGIAFLLYASSFLQASSAALLIAYCLDALLLRVLGWTLFIRLLPCGAPTLGSNLLQLGSNLVDSVSLLMWPIRGLVVGLWRLQGIVSSHGGDASIYSSNEALQEWDVGPKFNPFVFVTSPQELEEIFSGVCACQEAETAAAAAAAAAACAPCLNYIGVSLGYMLTAAAGLHLAASDLEDTMRLQFVSFFAVVAAVLNVSVIACVRLSGGEGWQLLGAQDTAAAEAAATAAAAAGAVGSDGSYTHLAITGSGAMETPLSPAAASGAAAGDAEGGVLHVLRWVFGGFVARTAIPAMVDAFGYSSSLPSWANEVQDEVPISKTVWLSSLFSAFFFCLFGCVCATAFVGAAESSNALASLLHGYSEGPFPLAAAAFICFFHVAALLPSIVLAQISSRYDLLNMAICLEKKSAFKIASTVPWLSYWLLSYQPLFAQPASAVAFVIGLILNFLIPLCTFIYASFYNDLLSASSNHGPPPLPARGALGALADAGREDAAAAAAAAAHDPRATAAAAAGFSAPGGPPLMSLGSLQLRDTGGGMGLGGLRGGGPHGERGGPSRGVAFAAVSGAVAGAGGARTREMQRQLHQWLVEFARRAPDSDVAQLLQREQEDSLEETGDGAAASSQPAPAQSMDESRGDFEGFRNSGSGVRGRTSRGSTEARDMSLLTSEATLSFPLLRGASSPSLCSSPALSDSPAAAAAAAEAAAAWRTGDDSIRSLGSPSAWNRGGSSSPAAPLAGDRTPDAATDVDAAAAAAAEEEEATPAADAEAAAAGTETAAAQTATEAAADTRTESAGSQPATAEASSAADLANATAPDEDAGEAQQDARTAEADPAAAAAEGVDKAASLEAAADTTGGTTAVESAVAAAEDDKSSSSAPCSFALPEGAEAAERLEQQQQQEQQQQHQQQEQEQQQEQQQEQEAPRTYVRNARRLRSIGRLAVGSGRDCFANTIPAQLSDDSAPPDIHQGAAAEGLAASEEKEGMHEQQQQLAAPQGHDAAAAAAAAEDTGRSFAAELQERRETGEETTKDDPTLDPFKSDDSSSPCSSSSDSSSSNSDRSSSSSTGIVSAGSSSTPSGMGGLDSASEASRPAEGERTAEAEAGDSSAAPTAVSAADKEHSLLLPIVRVTAATAAAAGAAAAAADATAEAASAAAADFAAAVAAATAAAAQPGGGGGLRRRPRSKAIRPAVSPALLLSPAAPSTPTPETASFSNTIAAAAAEAAATAAATAAEGLASAEAAAAATDGTGSTGAAGEDLQPPPVFTRSRRRGHTSCFNPGSERSPGLEGPEASSSLPRHSTEKLETEGDLREPVSLCVETDSRFLCCVSSRFLHRGMLAQLLLLLLLLLLRVLQQAKDEGFKAPAETAAAAGETPQPTAETPQPTAGTPEAAKETGKAAEETSKAAGETRSAASGPNRGSLWSGWALSGLRYVALSPAKWRGASRLRRRENASLLGDPRVIPFPCLKTPRSERLAAFCLLLLVAACAFVAVAEDLIDAAFFSFSLLKQLLRLTSVSAVQLCHWLVELPTQDATSYLPAWLAAFTAS